MSQENVDAFRRGTEAINRGELDIAEPIHPEVVFEPLRSRTEGPFVGHEGMRRFIADTEEMFEVFHVSYTDVRDLGERVLAIGSIRMRAKVSGVEADVPTAVIAEFRDGLLWRFKDYGDPRSALRAAGDGSRAASSAPAGPRPVPPGHCSGASGPITVPAGRRGLNARLARRQGAPRSQRSPARSTPCLARAGRTRCPPARSAAAG